MLKPMTYTITYENELGIHRFLLFIIFTSMTTEDKAPLSAFYHYLSLQWTYWGYVSV